MLVFFITARAVHNSELENTYGNSERVRIIEYRKWGGTVHDYNKMCLSPDFYELFKEFDFILLCQTDALILGNETGLSYFMDMGYDYYGAPIYSLGGEKGFWISRLNYPYRLIDFVKRQLGISKPLLVGNGGFSLRSVRGTIALLKRYQDQLPKWFKDANEDTTLAWFSAYDRDYNACPVNIAKEFSCDAGDYDKADPPFGIHGKKIVSMALNERA